MPSQSEFEEIFKVFKDKFPPVSTQKDAVLKLTTQDLVDTFAGFFPELEFPRSGITRFMTAQGYRYEPEEVNERVRYFWLIGKGQET